MVNTDPDSAEVVRRLHRAFNDRDRDALLACLAEDACWHVAGENPSSGTHEGRDAIWADVFEPLWPSPAQVDEHDVVVHGDHAVAFGAEVHDFGDGPQTWPTVEVLALRDGRVTERVAFTSGQAELDAFLIRGCAAALEPDAATP